MKGLFWLFKKINLIYFINPYTDETKIDRGVVGYNSKKKQIRTKA